MRVFIDGKEGTTGLRLSQRLKTREDVTLLTLREELRKDERARKDMLNAADIAFLCLPDAAAKKAVDMIENPSTRVIDASTAHRTAEGWAYGFPELSQEHRSAVINGSRIAVPGCHASGFIALVYPLVKHKLVKSDYPFVATSITGYSGGGKAMIAQYEEGIDNELSSPRQYALTQTHKHLKEMQAITGLTRTPCFEPYVADYYSGMEISIPLFADMAAVKLSKKTLVEFFKEYYKDSAFIGAEEAGEGFIAANSLSQSDGMKILIGGNDERILLCAVYDNLGKGASGAALQCFNLMTGAEEDKGLSL